LLARPGRQPRDMLAYGFAALNMPAVMQSVICQLFGLAPHDKLPVVVECDNVALLATHTRASDVILMATEASVAEDIRTGRLAPLHFSGLPLLYAEIGIVHLYGRSLSPAAVLVQEALRGIAARAPHTAMFGDVQYAPAPGPFQELAGRT
jgi:DNA-binding transcriptional LysR family regulator